MKPVAHPTTYRGARFRSRLEARWAAFFDLAGWQWQYEPGDFEGWAPDFALIGANQVVMVEVKPINWHGGEQAMAALVAERADLAKVWQQHDQEILILGCYPVLDSDVWDVPVLGLLHESPSVASEAEHAARRSSPARACDAAMLWGGYDRALDFAASAGSFHYRIGGQADGDHHLRPVSREDVRHMWNRAAAAVQWRGR